MGKDEIRPAEIYNYTWGQIRKKSRVLSDAGFGKSERELLIGSGVVGDNTEDLSRLAGRRPLAEINDPQWIREELLDETGRFIKEEYQGQEGYLKFIKDHYGQEASMSTIFDKVSKAFKSTSIERPNWKNFPGRVFEFEELLRLVNQEDFIERYRGQYKGYPAFAVEYVDGNMATAYIRLSAILDKNKFKELAWQGFQGSVKEFQVLPQKILNAEGYLKTEYLGQQGYLQFALDHPEMFMRKRTQNIAGDNKPTDQANNILMDKTFKNVSAVLDDEVFDRLGWQQFQGNASEFQELIGKILNVNGSLKEEYLGQEGYLKFALDNPEMFIRKKYSK